MKSRIAAAVFALVVVCSIISGATGQSSSPDVSKFFAHYFEEQLRDDPEFATRVGRHEYDDRWSDLSKRGRERHRAHLQQTLEALQKFPLRGLSEQDRLRREPHLRTFYQGLVNRGKARLQAVVAVMRKLLHALFAMFGSNQTYDGAKLCSAGLASCA